jgi:hypothetical protein
LKPASTFESTVTAPCRNSTSDMSGADNLNVTHGYETWQRRAVLVGYIGRYEYYVPSNAAGLGEGSQIQASFASTVTPNGTISIIAALGLPYLVEGKSMSGGAAMVYTIAAINASGSNHWQEHDTASAVSPGSGLAALPAIVGSLLAALLVACVVLLVAVQRSRSRCQSESSTSTTGPGTTGSSNFPGHPSLSIFAVASAAAGASGSASGSNPINTDSTTGALPPCI